MPGRAKYEAIQTGSYSSICSPSMSRCPDRRASRATSAKARVPRGPPGPRPLMSPDDENLAQDRGTSTPLYEMYERVREGAHVCKL